MLQSWAHYKSVSVKLVTVFKYAFANGGYTVQDGDYVTLTKY